MTERTKTVYTAQKGVLVKTLAEFDQRMDELGIETMTPTLFMRERKELEQKFLEVHRVAPAMINPLIKSGELEGDLVEQWIELMALEPYVFPHKARKRPERSSQDPQQGRESGLSLLLA